MIQRYYGGEGELLKYVCVGQVNKMWSCHGGHGFYFCSLCTLSEYNQVVELVNLAEYQNTKTNPV